MIRRAIAPILILLIGIGAWFWLGRPVPNPQPAKVEPNKMKTERVVLKPTRHQVMLESQGVVRAHHLTTITPLVAGKVVKIHACFEDGAFFTAGEVLAELDAADLHAELASAKSRLARAEASFAREEALAHQAELNWQEMGYKDKPSPLVLRQPQLKEAIAQVDAATAEVQQANRNLERCEIRAPFDGRVKSRKVGLGQSVQSSTALGEVFATDVAEVRLPLTPSQLPFVKLPTREGDAPVQVVLSDALERNPFEPPSEWQAQIVRTEGTLDENSRELFAIARIEDPFGVKNPRAELRIGQPVRARIEGITLENVFVIPRSALRGVNRIYRINQQQPAIMKTVIRPVWSDENVLVIRDGVKEGDWLATSRLPYAPNGAPVEIIEPGVADSKATVKPAGKNES